MRYLWLLLTICNLTGCKTPKKNTETSQLATSAGQQTVFAFKMPRDLPHIYDGNQTYVKRLVEFLRDEARYLKSQRTVSYRLREDQANFAIDADDDDDLAAYVDLLKFAMDQCEKAQTLAQFRDCYYNGLRSYYTLVAQFFNEQTKSLIEDEVDYQAGLERFVPRRFRQQAANFSAAFDRGYRINGRGLDKKVQAGKEPDNLDHGDGRYYMQTELARMTVQQVAALDVAPSHPIWRTRKENNRLNRLPGGAWGAL